MSGANSWTGTVVSGLQMHYMDVAGLVGDALFVDLGDDKLVAGGRDGGAVVGEGVARPADLGLRDGRSLADGAGHGSGSEPAAPYIYLFQRNLERRARSRDELVEQIAARLGDRASPLFLDRVSAVIDAAENGDLDAACTKVGKMVSLFVDQTLGEELARDLVVLSGH